MMKKKSGMAGPLQQLIRRLCLIAGICALTGCIDEYEADIPAEDSELLVVEGTICAGQSKFLLTRTMPLTMSTFHYITPFVTDATVSVRGSDGSEYIAKLSLADGGRYVCSIDRLDPDVEYCLHIESEGEVYESEPQKPLPTERIAEVVGKQLTPESDIDVLITLDAPADSRQVKYYSWTYDETWEVRPDYTTDMYFDVETKTPVIKDGLFPERGWKDATNTTIMVASSINYEGQHIRNLKLYGIGRGSEYIYYRYSGLIHQRAITKAEYEYELARRQAAAEMGGLFSPQPSALPTNIRCLTSDKRAIGFVGCSLNTSDYRFFLNGSDYVVYHPHQYDARRWFEDTTIDDCLELVERGMYLCVWEDDRMVGGKLRTAWAYDFQLDVRTRGAYIEKPEFW